MFRALHHIAVISSCEESIRFYEKLGFVVTDFTDRGYDKLYYLEGCGLVLEIFVDPTHPQRADRPEALGLRHLSFSVENLSETVEALGVPAEPFRESRGELFTFVRDLARSIIGTKLKIAFAA